jgi:hypothetical protein
VLLDLGARPNQATLENTQRKTTRAPAARLKPVRPLCQTGQTGFARLSQKPTHQNRSDLFPKPVTLVSPRELKLKNPKLEPTNSKLGETWARASSTKGRLVLRRSPPKHTFDQTGQTGFAQKNPQRSTWPKTKQTNSKRDKTWTRGLLRQRTTRLPKIFLNSHCDQNRSDLFPKPVRPDSPR